MADAKTRMDAADAAFSNMLSAVLAWDQYMDQWERVAIHLPGGRILYVTISEATDYPKAFTHVTPTGMLVEGGSK